jgi:hypothetical protein
MPLGSAEFDGQERVYEFPRHSRPHNSTAHTQNVHIVVFDSLVGGEMVMNQTCANTWEFIGADRGADAAAAHCDTPSYASRSHRLAERNHKIGIVIT